MGPPFDPSSIPPFSVIRLPYRFGNDPPVSKLFVVLGHKLNGRRDWYAICIKATSNAAAYADQRKRRGCVHYPARSLECFPLETFIEIDNQFPISHADIRRAHQDGQFESHDLPDDFETRLHEAIQASITLSPREKQRLLELLT